MWERVTDGQSFNFHPQAKPGCQYVAELSGRSYMESEKYDFIIANHVIEHIAYTNKCIKEWTRVLKESGILVINFSHKDRTFDRYRPVTKLSHLIEDYEIDVGEEDRTDISEIIKLSDLWHDPDAGTKLDFEKRLEKKILK